jgi:hypothetical protein
MNERIKQLAEQAGISTNIQTDFYEKDMNKWVDYFSEKFAELIVRECAGLLDGEWENEILCGSDAAGILKQHFGVEP